MAYDSQKYAVWKPRLRSRPFFSRIFHSRRPQGPGSDDRISGKMSIDRRSAHGNAPATGQRDAPATGQRDASATGQRNAPATEQPAWQPHSGAWGCACYGTTVCACHRTTGCACYGATGLSQVRGGGNLFTGLHVLELNEPEVWQARIRPRLGRREGRNEHKVDQGIFRGRAARGRGLAAARAGPGSCADRSDDNRGGTGDGAYDQRFGDGTGQRAA